MLPEHRVSPCRLTLHTEAGSPPAEGDFTITQVNHEFGFGNIGFDFEEHANGTVDRTALAELFCDVFNTATLPVYWGTFEPIPGQPRTVELRRTAEWFRSRGVRLKGHPLVWHTVKAPWLDTLDLDAVEHLVRQRIQREVTSCAGLIDTWDAINETVIMPEFSNEPDGVPNAISRLAQRLGRTGITALAVAEARSANPGTTLLINDFDLSPRYESAIQAALDAGIHIDAIGLQTHMHQGYRGSEQIVEICDRFARFGLPLHFTEVSLVSGDIMPSHVVDLNDYVVDEWPSTPEGEERQAREVADLYRTLFAHPAVEAITYWGITDAGAWLGAPIGLVRADDTPKPSYHALRELIRGEWWNSEFTVRSDEAGRIVFDGVRGDYEVRCGNLSARFTVSQNDAEQVVVLSP